MSNLLQKEEIFEEEGTQKYTVPNISVTKSIGKVKPKQGKAGTPPYRLPSKNKKTDRIDELDVATPSSSEILASPPSPDNQDEIMENIEPEETPKEKARKPTMTKEIIETEKVKHARSTVQGIRTTQKAIKSDREREMRDRARLRLRNISEEESEIIPNVIDFDSTQQEQQPQTAATSLDMDITNIEQMKLAQENEQLKSLLNNMEHDFYEKDKSIKKLNEKLREAEEENMKVVPISAIERYEMPSNAAKILQDSYSHIIESAMREITNKNLELTQTFTDAIAKRMSENEDQTATLKNIENTLQKIWSNNLTSDAKISTATEAVDTMTHQLNKMQDDRLALQTSENRSILSEELKKAKENELLATNSLALVAKQTYSVYFNVRDALLEETDSKIRNHAQKYLNDAREDLILPLFLQAIKVIGLETDFSYSVGENVYSFKEASEKKITPSDIVVRVKEYTSEGTLEAMLSMRKYRYRAAMVTLSFLNANAQYKLHSAKRMLEESKRIFQANEELRNAIERDSAKSALNKMNLALLKLSHSLKKKIMPILNYNSSEKNPLSVAIQRDITENSESILSSVKIIISFFEEFGLTYLKSFKKDEELINNLKTLWQFLTNSTLNNLDNFMETDIPEDAREVRKRAEVVSMTASDLSSNIDEIYNRAITELHINNSKDLVTKSSHVSDTLRSLLDDFKQETINVIVHTLENSRVAEEKGERICEDQKNCIERIAEHLCAKYKMETREWMEKEFKEYENNLMKPSINVFMLTVFDKVSERTTLLYKEFIANTNEQCSVNDSILLLPYIKILSDAQKVIETDLGEYIREFERIMTADASVQSQMEIDEENVISMKREDAKCTTVTTEQQKSNWRISPIEQKNQKDKQAREFEREITEDASVQSQMDIDEENVTSKKREENAKGTTASTKTQEANEGISTIEQRTQKAKQALLDTVKWANEVVSTVKEDTLENTKERKIVASLEDGKSVITMEPVDLSDPNSKTQTWKVDDSSFDRESYVNDESHVLRTVAEMRRAAVSGTYLDSPSLKLVKRHGITTQCFSYYLSRLSFIKSDKLPTVIIHPEYMRPLACSTTTALPKEQMFKILASDLMKTLRDNTGNSYSATPSPDIPSKLNMLIYNIFLIDADVLRNISTTCYTFRKFLVNNMKDKLVKDGNVRSNLLEATVAILFTACRHVFRSASNKNISQAVERRLAVMANMLSGGDMFRIRVCYVMYNYLQKYLKLCNRRVIVCLESLKSTGLASKKMMATPRVAEAIGSCRVSSFEVKYDFSMLYKLLSYQAKNISLLSELAFQTLESTIAGLVVFVNGTKLPIFDSNHKFPLIGDEIVLPTTDANTDVVHANWNVKVLKELSQSLTQYSAWLSKPTEEEEPEKLIRVCRAAAGTTQTCMIAIGLDTKTEDKKEVIQSILAPVKTENLKGDSYKSLKKKAAESVKTALTLIRSGTTDFENVIVKQEENCIKGSILTNITKAGSIATAAHVLISGFKDYLHDPEDFWGASLLFPPEGEGTKLEGWAKTYRSLQDVLEDFCDVSDEKNSPLQGLLIPPDFALSHLNIANKNNDGYEIETRDGDPPTQLEDIKTNEESYMRSEGTIRYLSPSNGVTISVPGKEKLRKSLLLKNALENSSMSLTRPIFDAQFQTNFHFETPKVVLLRHQWTCNSSVVSAAAWNLPSIMLLYQELSFQEKRDKPAQALQALHVNNNDNVNKAIGEIQSYSCSEDAMANAVKRIISNKKNNETDDKECDELSTALLKRGGTAPFEASTHDMYFTPGKINHVNLKKRAETDAEKLFVLTPSLLDIHPPIEQQPGKSFT